ncbi:TatD family hydrolase [Oscillospiraceae bacterium HV4-5-C5C]|nr:TatD family hydrolase [Oscillospiraceae bacterium HV4-5-C5C]
MAIIDTHCHLTDADFAQDYPAVIERAAAAGIDKLILVAYDPDSIEAVVSLAARYPAAYCAVGLHPSDADQWSLALQRRLETLLEHSRELKIVAVGEIGLDYHYEPYDPVLQQTAFASQLELARRFDLPVIIHERDAHEAALDQLRRQQAAGQLRTPQQIPGVFHCYSGSLEFARRLLPLGFYFGFDGPITFKNARRNLEALAGLPRDRVVIETDSPYLAPVPWRGHRNEPAYLRLIADQVAKIWELDPDQSDERLRQNSLRLFPGLNE